MSLFDKINFKLKNLNPVVSLSTRFFGKLRFTPDLRKKILYRKKERRRKKLD